MSKFGEDLIESLAQAAAHAEGRRVKGLRANKVEIPREQVKAEPTLSGKALDPSS